MDEHNRVATPENPTLLGDGKAAPILLWTFMGVLGVIAFLLMTV